MTNQNGIDSLVRLDWARATTPHLTVSEKSDALRYWMHVREREFRIGCRTSAAASGLPDPEMLVICDVLNEFDGVCTVQSCSGHDQYPAQLWLRLSAVRMGFFCPRGLAWLGGSRGVLRASLFALPSGALIVALAFDLANLKRVQGLLEGWFKAR